MLLHATCALQDISALKLFFLIPALLGSTVQKGLATILNPVL